MRVLLDTHAFLWMALDPGKLSSAAKRRITNSGTEKLLSLASVWEAAIKLSLGKLRLDLPLAELVEEEAVQNDVALLPIAKRHVLAVASLPWHHRDPFDRLLVTQSLSEGLAIVSADAAFDAYGVRRIW